MKSSMACELILFAGTLASAKRDTRERMAFYSTQGGGMGLSGREQQNRNQYTYVDEGSGGQC